MNKGPRIPAGIFVCAAAIDKTKKFLYAPHRFYHIFSEAIMEALAYVDIGAVSRQIVLGIRGLSANDFHEPVHYEWSVCRRFKCWEIPCAILTCCDLVPLQINGISAEIIQIPDGISQDVWYHLNKKTRYFVLGPREHFAKATRAHVSYGEKTHLIESGMSLETIPGLGYTFDVGLGGSLFLLCVRER